MKKLLNYKDKRRKRLSWLKRLVITKFLVIIFLTFTFAGGPGKVRGQSYHLNLDLEQVPIKEVLEEIENQTGLTFMYDNNVFNVAEKVSIYADNISLQNAIPQIIKGKDLKFDKIDHFIVVTPTRNSYGIVTTKQEPTITGNVTSFDGTPLTGVNITIQGTSQGTVTDVDGNYSIQVPDNSAVLVFSYIGFLTEKIEVGTLTQLDVVLLEDIEALEEIVVIGYGTQRKGDLTSSVASLKKDDFTQGSVIDAGQLIQGKVAGLTIIMPTGDPTDDTQILLRGSTSLMGKNQDPLILIDGIPGDMKTVSPQDIESIDVLKDGSAAAIYGTRGTNGVILITTRRAKGTESSVEYNTYFGTKVISRKLNLSSASEFREQISSGDRAVVVGDNVTYPMEDNGASTDWVKEISQTAVIQDHNLTLRSGGEKTNYLVNLNYNKTPGVFKKSYTETFSGRMDLNYNLFENKVKINLNLLSSTSDWWGFQGGTYYQALKQNPTSPVKNEDGTWFQELTKFEYQSPVSNIYEHDGIFKNQVGRYQGGITYNPFPDLKLSGIVSYSREIVKKGYRETKQHASTLRDNRNGYANIEGDSYIDRLAELTIEYSKLVDEHRFKILGGYSYQYHMHDEYYMENWDFPTDQFGWDNMEHGQAVVAGEVSNPMWSNKWETNLVGFFGRITYNYADKYLVLASIRREAASQLWGAEDPWGTFPAISVGWRITNESFMKNQNFINDIKLRAGYGVTGSQPSDLFKAVGILGFEHNIYSNGRWIQALVPTQNANPDLKWEEKHETDIGIDFSVLDNRISGSIDYYRREIRDLLWLFAVPTPPNLYNRTLANVGTMENKGLEVLLDFIPVQNKNSQWKTTIGYSTNKNKLVSLSNDIYELETDYIRVGAIFPPIQTFSHLLEVGGPVGNFYGYKVIGIGNDPEGDPANYGKWIYEGEDGNPVKYTDFGHSFEDKKVIGNGLPKFYLSWINNFSYKGFDISITQRGAFGFQVANLTRMMFENPQMKQYNVLNTAFDDIYGETQLTAIPEFNSYYIEDGDFWKIDNITLAYNFNKPKIKFIQSVRIYASVLNAFIFTKYSGIDPEISLRNPTSYVQSGVVQVPTSGLDPGMDSPYTYPTARTYSVGLNVKF